MILHKGETLFRQGETGPLYRLKSGLLKIIRLHADGTQVLVNIIVPDEIIPHHSLISPNPYYGTAVALVPCEVEVIAADTWYRELEQQPDRFREVALKLQEKLRMIQQRVDQLTQVTPAEKLKHLQAWFETHKPDYRMTELLTQDEIGQFLGLRRETINRLLRSETGAKKK